MTKCFWKLYSFACPPKKMAEQAFPLHLCYMKRSGKHLLFVITMGRRWYFWAFFLSCYFCISLCLHFHRCEQRKRPWKCVSCSVSFSETTPPASFSPHVCYSTCLFPAQSPAVQQPKHWFGNHVTEPVHSSAVGN